MPRLLLILTAIGTILQWSTALVQLCNRREHVQVKYCRADFVLKANVQKIGYECKQSNTTTKLCIVTIDIKSQIKISPTFIKLDDRTISQLHVSTKAAHLLRPSTKYLISGSLQSPNDSTSTLQLVVDDCDWIQTWASISARHKSTLRKNRFEQVCQRCKMSLSSGNGKTCDSVIEPARICYEKHSHCTLVDSGGNNNASCIWSHNRQFKECQRQYLTAARLK